MPISSLTVRQLGGTVVYTVVPGLHIGSTLKWVWGSGGIGVGDPTRSPDDWLEQGEDLDHGKTAHHFDLDAGVLATVGALRLGGVVKNLGEPTFGAHRWELPRQYRAGAALDLAATLKTGPAPLTRFALPVPAKAETPEIEVEAEITDAGGGIGRIEWRVNGLTVAVQDGARPFEHARLGACAPEACQDECRLEAVR